MEDYKQKYEIAIKQAKEELRACGDLDCDAARQIFRFFPELKESEDESVRQHLLKHFSNKTKEEWNGMPVKNILAWLGKQGEQKPTLPDFEEQEGVAGRDYIPVEWVEAIENYGKWKIVKVNEQKSAWSEEDEKMWSTVSELIWDGYKLSDKKVSWDKIRCWLLPKIKSLKERYTWKPSDEQMKQLGLIAKQNKDNMIGKELMSLYQELKKLKGE